MKLPGLLKLLLFEESRKVGFGLWLKVSSTFLLFRHLISADQWLLCVMAAASLVGGGTLMDKYMESKNAAKPAQQPEAR